LLACIFEEFLLLFVHSRVLITKICGVKIRENLTGQPLDKYLTQQSYETILLLHQGEQRLLLVLDLLNHLQVRKPLVQM
jgi:hypothetical protein